MMDRLFRKTGLIFFLMCFMAFCSVPAWAITLSGSVTFTKVADGGNIYIGVFDPENSGPGNLVASDLIEPSNFSVSDDTCSTSYNVSLSGDDLPEKVLVLAFYDRNNSCDPSDELIDWPDYGDVVGYAPASPITIGNSDINVEAFAVDTTYESSATLQNYDDFSDLSGEFLTDKWDGAWNALEYVRRVKDGVLSSGFKSSESRERNTVAMTYSGTVQHFKSDVKISDIKNGTGQNNLTFARLGVNLYNAVSQTPDSQTGDIWTALYLGEFSGQQGCMYVIDQCMDENNDDWEIIGTGIIPLSGEIMLDSWYGLEIAYDNENSQITYTLFDSSGSQLGSVTHTGLPGYAGASLDSYPALTTGMNRYTDKAELCTISAEFDNVEINNESYDDFSADKLDASKWRSTQTVRAIKGTDAVLMAESKGDKETCRLKFARKISHAYADVTIDESSFVIYGKARVRLEGDLYNDTYSGLTEYDGEKYNGDQGLVWAQVYIDLAKDESGNEYLKAKYYMETALVPEPDDDDDYTELVAGSFSDFNLSKGRSYRLGLNFTGTQVIFSCTDIETNTTASYTYNILTPAYPSQNNYFAVTARAYNYDEDSDGAVGCHVLAKVSQVYTGTPADRDNDTLSDFDELRLLYNPDDGDMDDDGIMDGNEDLNVNGNVDNNETDLMNSDTDGDGVLDGTEIGLDAAQIPDDADGFIADLDIGSTTDPLNRDTDGDGLSDGQEDANANGRVDDGESDPNDSIVISGQVLDEQGDPIAFLWLEAVSNACDWDSLNGAVTDSRGYYSMTVPSAGGPVYVVACPACNGRPYVNQWWIGSEETGSIDCNDAVDLGLGADEDAANIDFVLAASQTVSGRIILEDTTSGVANVHVQVFSDTCWNGVQYSQADTDEDGYFTISGVPVDSMVYLYVCPTCNDENYVGEWYRLVGDSESGTRNCYEATAVTVSSDSPVDLGTIAIAQGNQISGTVTGDGTGDDVEGMWVDVYDSDSGDYLGSGQTDSSGSYTVLGLPDPENETYQVILEPGDTYYVTETYADPVTPGATVDFTPDKGARVYGQVLGYDQVSGTSISLERVCVLASTEKCGEFDTDSGYTDANGDFSFIVPAGDIYLYAEAKCNSDLGYSSRFWTSSGMVCDCDSAEKLTLEAGIDTQVSFDLPEARKIYGTVRQSQTGEVCSGATVEVICPDDYGIVSSAVTNDQGEYSIYVDAGNYMIWASAPGFARTFYYYDEESGAGGVYPSSEATVVEVQSDTDQNIDFSLDVGGSISGTLYELDGTTPIADAQVFVTPSKNIFDFGFTAVTDAKGQYSVDCLALGLYKVKAEAEGFARLKYYSGTYGWDDAEHVVVQPPDDTGNIEISLEPEAIISGYVRAGDTGIPLEFEVIADPVNGEFEGIGEKSDIDNNGEYTIKGLPPRSYTIRLDALEEDNYYVGEFYNNAHSYANASTVKVDFGEHITNVNFDLEKGGQIRGRVVDNDTGDPIREVQIGASKSLIDGLPSAPGVDSEGYFFLNALPGSYKLNVFHGHGYIREYYQDAYTFELADFVTVQAGVETSLIEIRLDQGGTIEGMVYGDSAPSSPLAGVSLYAFPVAPDLPGAGTISNMDGTYSIEGLPTGKYVVKAVTSGYAMQCRTSDVTMPDTTYDIDLDLPSYPYSVDTKVEFIVGTSGGLVFAESDVSGFNYVGVDLSAGALSDDSLISISELESETVPMPHALVGINIPTHLGPEGTQFDTPAILQIGYTQDDLDSAGVSDPSELDVFTLNTNTFEWEKVSGNKTVDSANHLVEIELEHFSIYQLAYSTASAGDLDLDQDVDGQDVYTYILQAASGETSISLEELADHFGAMVE